MLDLRNLLADFESFVRNQYTRGFFIDLSKAFDTVNHSILIKKLQISILPGFAAR